MQARIGRVTRPTDSSPLSHGRHLSAANTGPEAAGYTLTDWAGGYLFATDGQVITGQRFVNVGPQITGNNVGFRGCEFRQTDPGMFVTRVDGNNATFEDCRWRPHDTSATPVTMAQSYQQGIKVINGVGLTVRRSEFWGFGNAIEFEPASATQALPILIEDSWMHDAADQAGSTYHHDGILSSYAASWVTVRRCRIVSGGNTNAIAFQSTGGTWTNVQITDCSLGGFGYVVNIGDDYGASTVTFTGNDWDTTIAPTFGPLKNDWAGFGGGNTWAGNTIRSGVGEPSGYWWPTDSTAHPTDY